VITSFASFRVDTGTRQLLRDGHAIRLSPKAFELLVALLDERPRVLSKADLQARLWPNTYVAEANLSNLIGELRIALSDRARPPRFVRTAPRYGYAFCGEATADVATKSPTRAASPQCWFAWGDQRFVCDLGQHIIGRDEFADVRLDSPTISRRHARVMVEPDRVQIDDLGSKNGTFRGRERVTESVTLADGDLVRIGSIALTFHMRQSVVTTDTSL